MKLSNFYTTVRICLAPVIVFLFFVTDWTGCCSTFSAWVMIPLLGFAEFTDFLDGYYARKRNEVSDFGKLFDPFADVLLHLTTFLCCVLSGFMPVFLFLIVIYREFGMNFFRMLATKKGIAIGARKGGKTKTVLYVITSLYVFSLVSLQRLGVSLDANMSLLKTISYGLSTISVVASLLSFVDYLKVYLPVLKEKN